MRSGVEFTKTGGQNDSPRFNFNHLIFLVKINSLRLADIFADSAVASEEMDRDLFVDGGNVWDCLRVGKEDGRSDRKAPVKLRSNGQWFMLCDLLQFDRTRGTDERAASARLAHIGVGIKGSTHFAFDPAADKVDG